MESSERIALTQIAKYISQNDKKPGLSLDKNFGRIVSELGEGKLVVCINREGDVTGCSTGGQYFLELKDGKEGKEVVGFKKDKFFFRYYVPDILKGKIIAYRIRKKGD